MSAPVIFQTLSPSKKNWRRQTSRNSRYWIRSSWQRSTSCSAMTWPNSWRSYLRSTTSRCTSMALMVTKLPSGRRVSSTDHRRWWRINQTVFCAHVFLPETIDDEFEWELRHLGEGWLVANHANFANWKKDFEGLRNSAGKVSAEAARTHLMKSKLPSSTLSRWQKACRKNSMPACDLTFYLVFFTLRRVWLLSDIDNDGSLTEEEFCLALFLIQRKLEGKELPKELPEFLIPSSPRSKDSSRDHEE